MVETSNLIFQFTLFLVRRPVVI